MPTASLSTCFELKLVNDSTTPFTVPALGRGYNIVEMEITTSGGVANVLMGRNDVSSNVFMDWTAGGAGVDTTSFALVLGNPVFYRAEIGATDTVVVNPISSAMNQLLLTCIDPSATTLTTS